MTDCSEKHPWKNKLKIAGFQCFFRKSFASKLEGIVFIIAPGPCFMWGFPATFGGIQGTWARSRSRSRSWRPIWPARAWVLNCKRMQISIGTVGSKAKEDVVGTKLWDPRTSPLPFGQGMEGEGEDLETRFINGGKSRQEAVDLFKKYV